MITPDRVEADLRVIPLSPSPRCQRPGQRQPYLQGVTSAQHPPTLRRGVLAASLLDDLPLEATDLGVRTGPGWDDRESWSAVPWPTLHEALHGADPVSATGRLRLRDWLRARHAADQPNLRERAVALALPRDHALHPGPSWGIDPIRGGVLDLGIGLRHNIIDAPPRSPQEMVTPLPTTATAHAGLNTGPWWQSLLAHRDAMASLAVDRLTRDGGGMLRPIGGCDVLTLLTSPVLRYFLAHSDGTGMRALGAPMRDRAWFDLARIDPAFVSAAAMATDPAERGLLRPVLVTAEEVGPVPELIDVSALARNSLADPARTGRQFGGAGWYR